MVSACVFILTESFPRCCRSAPIQFCRVCGWLVGVVSFHHLDCVRSA
jgi:hypothetical protein